MRRLIKNMTANELEQILNGESGKYINAIKIDGLKDFVKESLLKYGDTNKVLKANTVTELLEKMLIKKKQINKNSKIEPSFFDVLRVASLLHNLFYNGTMSSLFLAREKLLPIANKLHIPDNYINSIFQTIECQLGEDTPIPQCKPVPGTPMELFAWSCWYIEELHGNKKMPNIE